MPPKKRQRTSAESSNMQSTPESTALAASTTQNRHVPNELLIATGAIKQQATISSQLNSILSGRDIDLPVSTINVKPNILGNDFDRGVTGHSLLEFDF